MAKKTCHFQRLISASALGVSLHGHRLEVLSVRFVSHARRPVVDVRVPFVAELRGADLPQLLQLSQLLCLRGLGREVAEPQVADNTAREVGQPPTATTQGLLKEREGGSWVRCGDAQMW